MYGINKIVPLSERQAFELRIIIKSYRCLTVLSEGGGLNAGVRVP